MKNPFSRARSDRGTDSAGSRTGRAAKKARLCAHVLHRHSTRPDEKNKKKIKYANIKASLFIHTRDQLVPRVCTCVRVRRGGGRKCREIGMFPRLGEPVPVYLYARGWKRIKEDGNIYYRVLDFPTVNGKKKNISGCVPQLLPRKTKI